MTYTYDVENRLIKAVTGSTTVNLTYDPLGRLFQVDKGTTATTTKFVYDGDADVLEYNSGGAVTNRYVHGSNAAADDPLIWYAGSTLGTLRYLHADHLGSIAGIASSTGANYAIDTYDEYGINGSANNTAERFGYTGQAFIPELGLYYYKARFYSPTLGRFLQTDPIGYKDQINLYEYVGDDPVDENDFTGEETPCAGKGGNCGETGDAAKQFKEHPVRTALTTGAFVAPLAAAAAPALAAAAPEAVSAGTVQLDTTAIIKGVEGGAKGASAIDSAIGSRSAQISPQAAREFLKRGSAPALRDFMKSRSITVARAGAESTASGLRAAAAAAGRSIQAADARIAAAAKDAGATLLTYDQRLARTLTAIEESVEQLFH